MITTRFALIPGLLLILGGCMTDATVELTKAPFDATTQLTDGTTGATKEFLDPTTEFTSSTTPGALSEGGLLRAKQKATFFAMQTQDNLREDIARGQGEYLASLAALTGVPADQWPALQDDMRQSYPTLFDEQLSPGQSSERVVETAWAHGYGKQVVAHR
ncbi:DUF3015 domain-containing protein [Nitrospirales bacterium NOB]|nr:MAG: hypothetical protein UZ03_NOB001002891 [Nitrospira sp. OLB3]MBV6469821.1 hypothetical protein [Nitrospirota bacterium]MCK6494030.1 DUF3015 domain-containing protein [Nitrospira sp.]MDL1888855.1 DUF3015 domain-containing protein [Nitrospirales bacterium NOB]MEB2339953.1 DUF3015 family protein [Nitrospirales bacterium]